MKLAENHEFTTETRRHEGLLNLEGLATDVGDSHHVEHRWDLKMGVS
jgi:hypothetical protein